VSGACGRVAAIAVLLFAAPAFAQALTPEQQELVAGCRKYATKVYAVVRFGEPSVTQEFNSTYTSFKGDDKAITCEYLTNPDNGHVLFHTISADGVPKARLLLGDEAERSAAQMMGQFFAYYYTQGLKTEEIEALAREWLDSLQVRHFQKP
jgi:hypothetical protein